MSDVELYTLRARWRLRAGKLIGNHMSQSSSPVNKSAGIAWAPMVKQLFHN